MLTSLPKKGVLLHWPCQWHCAVWNILNIINKRWLCVYSSAIYLYKYTTNFKLYKFRIVSPCQTYICLFWASLYDWIRSLMWIFFIWIKVTKFTLLVQKPVTATTFASIWLVSIPLLQPSLLTTHVADTSSSESGCLAALFVVSWPDFENEIILMNATILVFRERWKSSSS